MPGYNKAPNGSCKVCLLPPERRGEVEARIVRGDTWEELAVLSECSWMTVQRHMQNGHIQINAPRLRDWANKGNVRSPIQVIETTRTKVLAESAEAITAEDISRRFIALERYAFRILDRLERDEDWRGSTQCIESLRRLADSLATVNGVKAVEAKDPIESPDVANLRESIVALFQEPRGGLTEYKWKK